jgi:ADP-ribose pyrophosphatase YjhB (NUDIX family)
MNYCSECGAKVSQEIPAGDDRLRYVCKNCSAIHYQNPKLVVGSIPISGEKILLCRRAIEPRRGLWTLPAGFMENGETAQIGAERETWEEAGAKLDDTRLYRLFDIPHISQVYIFFLGTLRDNHYEAGIESLEVALFEEHEIPWEEIAFPVIKDVLMVFFEDKRAGSFPVKVSTSQPRSAQDRV